MARLCCEEARMTLPDSYEVRDGCFNCKHCCYSLDLESGLEPWCNKFNGLPDVHPCGLCEHHEREAE